MMQNLEKNWLVSKLTWEIWRILTQALESFKNLHLNWHLSTKVYYLWAKKNGKGVIFHDTEEWCKIWRKTDLWFGKWQQEFGKFPPVYELKVYRGVMCQDNEECCKFWRRIDMLFQNWHEDFDLSSRKSQNLRFNGLFLTKVYNVWAKKVQRSYVWWHWRLMQNLKENWLVLSIMTRELWQMFTGWEIVISL